MPTLHWVGKDKVINHHEVQFRVLNKVSSFRTSSMKTKGDDRDNPDAELKLKPGKPWQARAGSAFHYMMLFENKPIDGAERPSDALRKLAQL